MPQWKPHVSVARVVHAEAGGSVLAYAAQDEDGDQYLLVLCKLTPIIADAPATRPSGE